MYRLAAILVAAGNLSCPPGRLRYRALSRVPGARARASGCRLGPMTPTDAAMRTDDPPRFPISIAIPHPRRVPSRTRGRSCGADGQGSHSVRSREHRRHTACRDMVRHGPPQGADLQRWISVIHRSLRFKGTAPVPGTETAGNRANAQKNRHSKKGAPWTDRSFRPVRPFRHRT